MAGLEQVVAAGTVETDELELVIDRDGVTAVAHVVGQQSGGGGHVGARAAGHVKRVAAGTAIVKDESAEVRRDGQRVITAEAVDRDVVEVGPADGEGVDRRGDADVVRALGPQLEDVVAVGAGDDEPPVGVDVGVGRADEQARDGGAAPVGVGEDDVRRGSA